MRHPFRDPAARIFGERLAQRRHELGLSQQELANRLQLAASETISRYERGIREPRLSTIMRMADALRVPVDYFTNSHAVIPTEAAYDVDDSLPGELPTIQWSADSEREMLRHPEQGAVVAPEVVEALTPHLEGLFGRFTQH